VFKKNHDLNLLHGVRPHSAVVLLHGAISHGAVIFSNVAARARFGKYGALRDGAMHLGLTIEHHNPHQSLEPALPVRRRYSLLPDLSSAGPPPPVLLPEIPSKPPPLVLLRTTPPEPPRGPTAGGVVLLPCTSA
jgi:hypothetical protein